MLPMAELQREEIVPSSSLNAQILWVKLQQLLVDKHFLFAKPPPAATPGSTAAPVSCTLGAPPPHHCYHGACSNNLSGQQYSLKVNSIHSDSDVINHFLCIGIFLLEKNHLTFFIIWNRCWFLNKKVFIV